MSQFGLLFTHGVHLDGGAIIDIVGSVSHDPCSFHVTLFASDDDSDVALRFSTRFLDNVIVTKSKENGSWSEEERASRFPFKSDQTFVLTIVTTPDCYVIKVNGELLHSFCHRLPLDHIKRLSISEEASGDDPSVHIAHVSVQESTGIPRIFKSQISTPYDRQVHLSVGDAIRVCGSVSRDPNSFGISLLSCDRGDDSRIPFHFNVRFDDNEIVMNAKERGMWGEEERSGIFPFADGEGFVAVIRVRDEGYEIVINGQHVHLFRHRIQLDQVQRLFIVDHPQGQCLSLFLGLVSLASTSSPADGGYRVVYFVSQTNGGNMLVAHNGTTVAGGGGFTKQSQFKIIPIDARESGYYLESVQFPDQYLAIQDQGVSVVAKREAASTFQIDRCNDGYYEIWNESQHQYIGVKNDGTVTAVASSTISDAKFVVLQVGLGPHKTFVLHHLPHCWIPTPGQSVVQCASAMPSGACSERGQSLYLWNKENGGNLQLLESDGKILGAVGGGGETPQAQFQVLRVPAEGASLSVYALKSKKFANKYLAINYENKEVIVTDREGPPYPKWNVDWNVEGYYTIQSVDSPKMYIGVEKDGTVVATDDSLSDKIKFGIHFHPHDLGSDVRAADTDSHSAGKVAAV